MTDKNQFEVEIEDPWLGKRILGDKAALIEDQLKLLKHFRDDGRKPSQLLLDDIKVYEFILASQDPDIFAEKYLKEINRLRDERQSFSVAKLEVAKKLGWFK